MYLEVRPSVQSFNTRIRFLPSISFWFVVMSISSLPSRHNNKWQIMYGVKLRIDKKQILSNGTSAPCEDYLSVIIPLYQKILPNSCGPCRILHVKLMSLPLFTYKSVGPIIVARNSAENQQNLQVQRKKKERKRHAVNISHWTF